MGIGSQNEIGDEKLQKSHAVLVSFRSYKISAVT